MDEEFKAETVKVVRADHEGGFAVINKSDLTDRDVLFDEAKPSRARVVNVKASKPGDSDD